MSEIRDDRTPQTEDVLRKSLVAQKYPLWVRTWRSVHLGWLVAIGVLSAVLAATIVTSGLLRTIDADTLLFMSWLTLLMLLPLTLAVLLSGIGSARNPTVSAAASMPPWAAVSAA